MPAQASEAFKQNVELKFRIYNSLFLTLPFDLIHQTGTLLPLLALLCERKFNEGWSPGQIIRQFFQESGQFSDEEGKDQVDILFNFVKYIERQVVLFDAIEESAYDKVHDLEGPGTVEALFDRAAATRLTDELAAKLNDFQLRIVLTAHPTQFYPGHVLGIINDLANSIRNDDVAEINRLLQQLGKSPFLNRQKPTPLDEAISLIWYLENVFYHVLPGIVHKVRRRLQDSGHTLEGSDLIRMGFWPGGDRDGNPFVDCETTLHTAARLRRSILSCYHRDVQNLKRRLTFRHIMDDVAAIENKLFAGINESALSYQTADELLTDLYRVRDGLRDHHQGLFNDLVETVISKVKIFGLFFATLDIRQDSSKHREVVELFIRKNDGEDGLEQFHGMEDRGKVDYLLTRPWEVDPEAFDDPIHRDVVESMEVMNTLRERNGARACHRYIISNTQTIVDIFGVYAIARWALGENPVHMDIVPLFETIDDLQRAGKVMEFMYQHPKYAEHLQVRGNRQTIMLGFSDGTKDGGYLSANWSIFEAKEALTAISRAHGIDVIFFDGRGGPPARGGGNTHKFYSSLGPGIENKEVQLTIQGQTISSNFGHHEAAIYNIEQLLSAGVENSVFQADINMLDAHQRTLLAEMASRGLQAYTAFKQDPLFLQYLQDMGTLAYYGETNIGSRPVKRKGDQGLTLSSLRAIPFVGSWSQMKQNVPGFYGFGMAIEELKEEGRIAEVHALYTHSTFFQTLVGNSMQALCKCFFPLTAHLAEHAQYGDFWNGINAEYERSVDLLLTISGQKELLEEAPDIRRSIQLREQIVLPLLTIQQHALEHIREAPNLDLTDEQVATYKKLVTRTMFGIINAGRNSA